MAMNFEQFEEQVHALRAAQREEREDQDAMEAMRKEMEKRKKVGEEIEDRIRKIDRKLYEARLRVAMEITFFARGGLRRHIVSENQWDKADKNCLHTLPIADETMIGYHVGYNRLDTLSLENRKELFPLIDRIPLADVIKEVLESVYEYNTVYRDATTVVVATKENRLFEMAFVSRGHAKRVADRISAALDKMNAIRSRITFEVTPPPQTDDKRMLLIWNDSPECNNRIDAAFQLCTRVLMMSHCRPPNADRDRDRS